MRRWGIAANCIYREAHLHMEEGHWLYFLAEEVVGRICSRIPAWPKLPAWPSFIIEGEVTNPRDWYGDPQQLFHAFICTPVVEWVWSRVKLHTFNLDYDEVEDQIKDDWCKDCLGDGEECYGTKKGDPIPEKLWLKMRKQ